MRIYGVAVATGDKAAFSSYWALKGSVIEGNSSVALHEKQDILHLSTSPSIQSTKKRTLFCENHWVASEIQDTEWGHQEQCHTKTYMLYVSNFPEVRVIVISVLSCEQIVNPYLPNSLVSNQYQLKEIIQAPAESHYYTLLFPCSHDWTEEQWCLV